MTLLWLSCAFILGVVIGIGPGVPLLLSLALAAVLFGVAGVRRHSRDAVLFAAGACLCLGVARGPHGAWSSSPTHLDFYNGRVVTVDGVVDAEPDIRDTGANYRVSAIDVRLDGRTRPIQGRIAVHTSRAVVLDYGERVRLRGRLLTPRNTATAPYAAILARQGVRSEARFPRLVDNGAADTGLLGWVMRIRSTLEDGIDSWLPEPEAALLIAVTLGARSASLGDLTPVLISTGLIHIVAISGIKVALVAGTVYELALRARNRLFALLVSLAVLATYVALTGFTESGVRSALMWALVFVAAYLGRRTVALVSLSVVAAIMVALQPEIVVDIGFQLSVVGTAGIVAFADRLLPYFSVVPTPFREALVVTIGAQVSTLPIVAIGFRVLSPTGPIANALVLPLLPALIVLGFALGGLSTFPLIAAPLASVSYALLAAIVWLSKMLASLVGAIAVPGSPPALTATYYAVLGTVAWYLLRRAGWAPPGRMPGHAREFGVAVMVGISGLTLSLHQASNSGNHLTSLGGGEAVLVQSHGRAALIDGSPRPFRLLEALGQALPVTTHAIDLVIVTDGRASNVAGLLEVLRHYRFGEVLDVGVQYPSTTYARWRAALRAERVPIYGLRTGATVELGDVRISAVAPDALYSKPTDSAGMLRILGPQHTVLYAGAASRRELVEALFRPVRLRADHLVTYGPQRVPVAVLRAVFDAVKPADAATKRGVSIAL